MAQTSTQTPKRTKRSYTNEEIGTHLAVLKSNRGNLLRTSREQGIPYHTLREWATNGRRHTPEVEEIQHEKELSLAQKLKNLAHMAVDHASDPEVLAEASALDATKIAGIAVDKHNLLTGQPTERHEHYIDSRQVLVLLQETIYGAGDPPVEAKNITPAAGAV